MEWIDLTTRRVSGTIALPAEQSYTEVHLFPNRQIFVRGKTLHLNWDVDQRLVPK